MLGRMLCLLALVWYVDQFVPGVGWIGMTQAFSSEIVCQVWRDDMASAIEPEHRARWYAKTRCVKGEENVT